MPQGDPGGHFASSGGYGGNFGGAGGAAGNVSGSEHGMLGFGGMSPGGYNSTTYANNMAGIPGTPGFGARRAAAQRARQLALQKARRQARKGKGKGKGHQKVLPAHFVPVPLPQPKPVLGRPYPVTGPYPKPQLDDPWADAYRDPMYGMLPDRMLETDTWGGPWGEPFDDQHPPGGIPAGTYHQNPQVNSATQSNQGVGTGVKGDQWGHSGGPSPKSDYGGGRAFGGPVAPGKQYTVGENGPETLQMNATGGGQVIPHNPMDRATMPYAMQPIAPGHQIGGGQQNMGGGFQRPPQGGGFQQPPQGGGPYAMQPMYNPSGNYTAAFQGSTWQPPPQGGNLPGPQPTPGGPGMPTPGGMPQMPQMPQMSQFPGGVGPPPGGGPGAPAGVAGRQPMPPLPLGGLNAQTLQQWMQLLRQQRAATGPGQGPGPGGLHRPPGAPDRGGNPWPVRQGPGPGADGGFAVGGGDPGQNITDRMQARFPDWDPGQYGNAPGGGQRPPGGTPGGGTFRLGDWRNRMGIEGLSRPPRQRPDMGFGGSGLGIEGLLAQMQRRQG